MAGAAREEDQFVFEYSEPDTMLFLCVFAFLSAIGLALLAVFGQWFNALILVAIDALVLTQMDLPITRQAVDPASRTLFIIHRNLFGDRVERFEFIKVKEVNLETFTSYMGEQSSTVCLRLELRNGRSAALGGVRVYSREAAESLRETGKKLSSVMCIPYSEKEFGD